MFPRADFDLQPRNTLAAPARAQYFWRATTVKALCEALEWARSRVLKVHVLGGGSNVVLASRLAGMVLQPALKGVAIAREDTRYRWLRVAAGEDWHRTVVWALANGCFGLENLALIPGSVGAAPVQNIGAYGVELQQVMAGLTALDRTTGKLQTFDTADCGFAYRDSIFKSRERERFVITEVTLRCHREPRVTLTYPSLIEQLRGIDQPTPRQVFEAVCRVRARRLPDPQTLPNCGSFFKNPLVSERDFHSLQSRYPDIVAFDHGAGQKKLAAAWLIEQCGWKGQLHGSVKVHDDHALVLCNPRRVAAEQVLELASAITASVAERFGVTLELEPQCMGL